MQQSMWKPILVQVANFLTAGMKIVQTVDSDEGSNIESAGWKDVIFLPCLGVVVTIRASGSPAPKLRMTSTKAHSCAPKF